MYAFIGSFFTIYVAVLNINPIVSSSLVAIIISLFTVVINDENHYSWAAFCGTFAGMISLNIISESSTVTALTLNFLLNAFFLSAITGVFYCLGEFISYKYPKAAFDGYGGKLGTLAFLSVILYIILQNIIFKQGIAFFQKTGIFYKNIVDLDFFYLLCIPSSVLGALISMEIKNTVSSLNDNYRVLTVAITGIIGGILVTQIPVYGTAMGQAWYAGAFVGMSSFFVLMLKRDYIISGTISGIIFIITKDFFPGFGGKLGFMAFISVLFTKWLYLIAGFIKSKNKKADNVVDSLLQGKKIENETVDDDYAQQLVESLLRAKQDGSSIVNNSQNDSVEHHLIIEETNRHPEQIAYLLQALPAYNLDKWVLLKHDGSQFIVESFSSIDEETNQKMSFSVESRFIRKLQNHAKPLGFAFEGVNQPIFKIKMSEKDFIESKAIYILPLFNESLLEYILFVFDITNDMSQITQNFSSIKLLNEQIFGVKTS